MGPGHRLLAANVAMGLGLVLPVTPAEVAVATVGAVVFSAGRTSPDLDNRPAVRAILGHRETLHWWGWPVLASAGLAYLGLGYAFWGPVVGWSTHLIPGDWAFGKGGRSIPKGIPMWPWRGSRRLGLGLRVTGRERRWGRKKGQRRDHSALELTATILLAPLAVYQGVALLAALGA